MSETDALAEMEAQIESKLDSEESQDESEVESDAVTEEEQSESETEEAEPAAEEETEESKGDESVPESEANFDFHDTSTSLQQLVSNLKNLSPADREERISKLTREKEIEAVKEAFPDAIKEDSPVSRKELEALQAKLEEMSSLQNPEELQKALEIAAKLNATESMTDGRLKTLMLQEMFGESHTEITKDPKFITAYEKYPKLTIEERLEIACSQSPVAKKLATDSEVKKQVRLKSTKTVSKGKQTAEAKELSTKDVKSVKDLEKLFESKFN